MNNYWIEQLHFIIRILAAGLCGGIIGYERQRRRKFAGIKTHSIVALSSALMIILSKYGFYDVLSDYIRLDPSRVAAGIVTAIGFLGSGVILFGNNNVTGITTAAGIWATVGVGMIIGSGMYFIGCISTILIILIEMFIRERYFPWRYSTEDKNLSIDLLESEISLQDMTRTIEDNIKSSGGSIIGMQIKRLEDKYINISYQFSIHSKYDVSKLIELIESIKEIKRISI